MHLFTINCREQLFKAGFNFIQNNIINITIISFQRVTYIMSGNSDPVIQKIVALHKEGDYFGIINEFRDAAFSNDKSGLLNLHLVTWPLPREKDLQEFAEFSILHNIRNVYSIGCGTGLLEWLILKGFERESRRQNATSTNCLNMHGIEVDSKWWKSAYSPPKFIPLQYAGEDFDSTEPFGNSDDLAIFCYFNNIKIFLEYLKSFQGEFVILIGPISSEQFCAQGPLELADENVKELPTNEWNLVSCQQFGFVSVDHLAIYQRKLSKV